MDDVLVDEALSVHYGQFYVSEAGKGNAEFEAAFRGQANGLLGAAVASFLHITTGLHTGHVWITVSLHVDAPPRDPASEDEVEATFVVPPDVPIVLNGWARSWVRPLPLAAGPYRVRLSAQGMDQAQAADTLRDEAEPLDRYHLSFWPAPAKPDTILRQTSAVAAYWHRGVAERTE